VADHHGIGRGFFQGREQELTGTHVWPFCRLLGLGIGRHCTVPIQWRTGRVQGASAAAFARRNK
jgi:hypothetical protein